MQATAEGVKVVAGDGYSSCRNCRLNVPIKGRGLCNPCYNDRMIRHRFSRMGKEPSECGKPIDVGGERPIPHEPTLYPPGSPGKILLLCARAMAGFALWHPEDYPTAVKRSYPKG